MFDIAIIGGGPAGTAAAVYAARKLLKTVLITDVFGGQSVVSTEIQNWIGTPAISGEELAKNLKKHVLTYAGDVVEVAEGQKVTVVTKSDSHFVIKTNAEKTFEAKTILVATGGERRKLKVPGAAEFDNKGLTYCASCDGPLFSGQDTVVIGGGNAGFETAAQLLAYTKSVTLLQRGPEFVADPSTVKKILEHPNMRAFVNAQTTAVLGEKFVTGLSYKDTKTGAEETLNVAGIFIEIGMIPSTSFVADLVTLDTIKRIVIDPTNQRTNVDGIWAAGDCTNVIYHQNNIAAGDAVRALEDMYIYLSTH